MDNDTQMLQEMGNTVVLLQIKYKMSSIENRAVLRPALQELLEDYAKYQIKLLKDGVITTDSDLKDMAAIRAEIDTAGDQQAMLLAIARTVAFIAANI